MEFDSALAVWLNSLALRWPLVGSLSILAAQALVWGLIAWCVIAFVWHKRGGLAEFFALAVGGGSVYLANALVSLWWFRLRPFVEAGAVPLIDISPLTKSFPSDHAAIAFYVAYLLVRHEPLRWYTYLLAVVVALGRVLVGVHYPLDVFAGAVVGLVFGYLVARFVFK